MSRKVVSSLLILILLVLFAGTYYCSKVTESLVTHQLSALNRQLPQPFQINMLNYQRGLFISRVRTEIQGGRYRLPLEHQLRHYLWGSTLRTTLDTAQRTAQTWQPVLPPKDCALVSRISLNGQTQNRLDCIIAQAEAPAGDWSLRGLVLSGETTEDRPFNSLNLQLEQLQLEGKSQTLSLADLSLSIAGHQTAELINGELQLALGSIQSAAGPFSKIRLHIAVAALPSDLARELLVSAVRLEETGAESQLQLLHFAKYLLRSNLRLEVRELTASHGTGGIQGQGRLQLRPQANPLASLLNLTALEAASQLRFDQESFRAGYQLLRQLQNERVAPFHPEVLRAEADLILDSLVRRGLVRKRPGEDLYGIDLRLQDGRLALNEKD